MGADGTIAALLRKLAEGRREYAQGAPSPDRALLLHEAEALANVADALGGTIEWSTLVGAYAPSWRWAEFGEHDPLPITHTSDDCVALDRRLARLRGRAAGAGVPAGDTGDQP